MKLSFVRLEAHFGIFAILERMSELKLQTLVMAKTNFEHLKALEHGFIRYFRDIESNIKATNPYTVQLTPTPDDNNAAQTKLLGLSDIVPTPSNVDLPKNNHGISLTQTAIKIYNQLSHKRLCPEIDMTLCLKQSNMPYLPCSQSLH